MFVTIFNWYKQSEQFEKEVYIHSVKDRINFIRFAVNLHREFIKEFDESYYQKLEIFEEYGYFFTDCNSSESVLEKLSQIEQEEAMLQPIGRIGKPAEVAELAYFLAQDSVSFITGAIIPIDGGYIAR